MTQQFFAPSGGAIIIVTETAPVWDGGRSELDYRLFSAEFVQRVQPNEVACWLFCAEYDAVDIARILAQASYGGTLRTRSVPLPRPGIIRREILRECPGLRLVMETGRPDCGGHHPYEAGVLFPGPVVERDVPPELLIRTA